MNLSDLTLELEQALAEVPILDIHTHLIGGKLGARGLHDVLLYHMAVSDLYGAGCPTGKRLTEYPKFPSDEEAHARIQEALPYLAKVQNTSTSWGIRILLKDLYNWTEPITEDNWRRLDATIRERADDRSWHHSILDRLNIKRTGTEIARRGNGEDDERFQYALEWGFFTRCQWKEFDTALHELESCWGNSPLSSPSPIGAGGRAPTKHTIHTVDDLREAVHYYVSNIPYDKVLATATHIIARHPGDSSEGAGVGAEGLARCWADPGLECGGQLAAVRVGGEPGLDLRGGTACRLDAKGASHQPEV